MTGSICSKNYRRGFLTVATALWLSGASANAIAADVATLLCRQGGLSTDAVGAATFNCNGAMSDECKRSFEEAIKSQYGRSDWYSAATEICHQLPAKGGEGWYPHEIRVR